MTKAPSSRATIAASIKRRAFRSGPKIPTAIPPPTQKYRYTWTMPIVISSHNPDVIYHTSQYVFRSNDAGRTWTTISPDLTRNDKSKQQDSGGPLTKDQYTVEYYDVIFSACGIAQSRKAFFGPAPTTAWFN